MTIKECATKGTDFILYCTKEELQYISDGLDKVLERHSPNIHKAHHWLTGDEIETTETMHDQIQEILENVWMTFHR